jgi:hypothetical protein
VNLSNENLRLLSKFAAKAKKHIGLIKLERIFTNPHYASNILIKAGLSDNQELSKLTKMVNSELNINVIEMTAIECYIASLSEKSASRDFIWNSKYFLIMLADYLYGVHADGASYRLAVEAMLSHADTQERDFCISLARDFYPFWMGECKLAFDTNQRTTLKLNQLENESINETSLELWNTIESEFFSDIESQPLNLYIASLQQTDMLSEHINTRRKFALILIKELRSDNSGKQSYRKTVDKIQGLFISQDLKEFISIVSREFYSFWTGNRSTE